MPLTLLFFVAALATFVVAAALIGREAFRLGHQPAAAIFDVEEAVQEVGDLLAPEHTAVLSYDDVRMLIGWATDHFARRGVLLVGGQNQALLARGEEPDAQVVDEDEAVAVMLGRADDAGLEVADAQVTAVLDALLVHLRGIGAVGPRADEI